MKDKVALIIVFNHKYDNNIEILDNVYKNRFSNIYYLVPFYTGNRPNVISVYENSYYFQGYFVQGFNQYFNDNYQHYFFLADDMVINPNINESNYQQYFNLSSSTSFIPELYSLDNMNNNTLFCAPATIKDAIAKFRNGKIKKWYWSRVKEAYEYNPNKLGVESINELPKYSDAEAQLKKHGIQTNDLRYADVRESPNFPNTYYAAKNIFKHFFGHNIFKYKYKLNYPLVGAYSDIVIVSHDSIKKFIHYCGVFTATELFVELAIPTALLLSSSEVVTQPIIGKKGMLFWPHSPKRAYLYDQEMKKYDYDLKKLIEFFPEDKLYIHPIKLSKWKV